MWRDKVPIESLTVDRDRTEMDHRLRRAMAEKKPLPLENQKSH
jgi:hypothetical protein